MSVSKLVGEIIKEIKAIKVHEGGEDKRFVVITMDKEAVTYPCRESVYLIRKIEGMNQVECCIKTDNGVCTIGIGVTKAEKARKERELKNMVK